VAELRSLAGTALKHAVHLHLPPLDLPNGKRFGFHPRDLGARAQAEDTKLTLANEASMSRDSELTPSMDVNLGKGWRVIRSYRRSNNETTSPG
jgi:hypothetical protein